MADLLLNEIDDAVRRDKLEQFWRNNKTGIYALCIALVIGTGVGQAYRHFKDENNSAFTFNLLEGQRSLEKGDPKAAATAFKQAADKASGEEKALALTWAVRAEINTGDIDAAKATLAEVIKNGSKNGTWRDLACVWTAGLGEALPKECAGNADTPLLAMKRELAAADAIAAKDYDRARAELEAIKGANTATPEQRNRAMQLELLLPPAKQPEKAATK